MRIGTRDIGLGHKPLVIAEIGINHEGSFEKARAMVRCAAVAGAEVVKFQMHIIEDEMVPAAEFVIPANADESIYNIMARCRLTVEEHAHLKEIAESYGLIYLCTPFSRQAADILEKMGVAAYKIGSGECNNVPLVKHIAAKGKPIILSTGMNDLTSIRTSVEILDMAGVDYALLHCTSLYPTPYAQVRLGAMVELQNEFPGIPVGLSDHSIGNYTSFGAVALGASVVEKHFTVHKDWPGPDVPISIDPPELADLVRGSRAVFEARGGRKEVLQEEQATIDFAYASVVTIREVAVGEEFTEDNLWVKRPGIGGIRASCYEQILGKKASCNIPADCQVTWGMIV